VLSAASAYAPMKPFRLAQQLGLALAAEHPVRLVHAPDATSAAWAREDPDSLSWSFGLPIFEP
jgi:hypothetical protein